MEGLLVRNSEAPPKEGLVRASFPGVEMRAEDSEMPTLFGYFTRFNEWTEIDSFFEGHFMERVATGSMKKSIEEKGPGIKVLFQHGRDPQVGDKPLGVPEVLEERTGGAYYEVPMLDTSYNRELIPGLEAGAYGASFRFTIVKEEFNTKPGESEHNPQGLPERTIKEIELHEFGPVTFPAYAGASAGVRSLTDEFIFQALSTGPGLERLAEFVAATKGEPAKTTPPPEPAKTTPGLYQPNKRPSWAL